MIIQYRSLKKWKYQLTNLYCLNTSIKPSKDITSEFIELKKNGSLLIKRYYAWDGASGGIDTDNFMRGSLVHDAFCNLIAEGRLHKYYRVQADDLLYKILLEDGMSRMRAWWVRKSIGLYVKLKY